MGKQMLGAILAAALALGAGTAALAWGAPAVEPVRGGVAAPVADDPAFERDAPVLALAGGLLGDLAQVEPLVRQTVEEALIPAAGFREEGYLASAQAYLDSLTWGSGEVRAAVAPLGYDGLVAYALAANPGIAQADARALADAWWPQVEADPAFFATLLFNAAAPTLADQMLQSTLASAVSSLAGPVYFAAPDASWNNRTVLLFVGEPGAEEALVVCGLAPVGDGGAMVCAQATWLPGEAAAWVRQSLVAWLDQAAWYDGSQLARAASLWTPERLAPAPVAADDVDAYLLGIAGERAAAIAEGISPESLALWGCGPFLGEDDCLAIAAAAGSPGEAFFYTLPAGQDVLDWVARTYPDQALNDEQATAFLALAQANPLDVAVRLTVTRLGLDGWYGEQTPESYAAMQEAATLVGNCMAKAGVPDACGLPAGWTHDVLLVTASDQSPYALVTVFAQVPNGALGVATSVVRLPAPGDVAALHDYLLGSACMAGSPYSA